MINDHEDIPGTADVPSAKTEEKHKGWHSRGYLPHFDAAHVLQFITFRLYDSVPVKLVEQWKHELHWCEGLDADSKEAAELRKCIELYADRGKGACYLRDEKHFNVTVEYILQNPVKAGLVDAPEKWPWSGYTSGNTNILSADSPANLSGGRDVRDPGITGFYRF